MKRHIFLSFARAAASKRTIHLTYQVESHPLSRSSKGIRKRGELSDFLESTEVTVFQLRSWNNCYMTKHTSSRKNQKISEEKYSGGAHTDTPPVLIAKEENVWGLP